MRVYIAGPYTEGDPAENTRQAILAADAIVGLGHVPHVPHLYHLWHLISPHDYEFWLRLDMEWLRVCDCVVRLPGRSRGADRECDEAARLGMPIYSPRQLWEAQ